MFMVSILSWWYGDGWKQRFGMIRSSLARTTDYFSFSLLFKTLFSPFRQISAGRISGPINLQLRAFVDQLISRLVGASVRSIVIIIGLFALVIKLIWGLTVLIVWALIPLLPLVGLGLTTSGWVPIW